MGVSLAALVALAAAACGASRTTVRTVPVASLSDAIACAVEQGEEMGFEVLSLDEDDHRVVLERTDPSVRRSDPKFQRAIGQLILERAGEAATSGRRLRVEARTFYEYFDRRGRTRRQRETSEEILAAADELTSRCASGGSDAGDAAAAG